MKKLTIITVCYNSEKIIQRCIDSIVPQLTPEIEYLIIDGASKDHTVDIIKKYKEIRYISEKDSGIYNAMNKGISLAKGEWIIFINSDDCLMPNILNQVLPYLNHEVDCVYGDNQQVIYDCDDIYYKNVKAQELSKLNHHMIACHQSIFMRKDMMIKLGGFQEKYKIAADWDLFIKVKESGYRISYIPMVISKFALGGLCTTNTYIWECHKIRKSNHLYSIIDGYFIKDFSNIIHKYRNKIAYFLLGEKFEKMKIKHNRFEKWKEVNDDENNVDC